MTLRFVKSLARHALPIVASPVMLLAGCGDDSTAPGDNRGGLFTVRVVNETFKVQVSDSAQVAALRNRLSSGSEEVSIGALASGNGGFNTGYSWHLDPATVKAVDVAIEVCDGRPSDVQGDLPYWLNTVKSYCPWGAKVIREE